MNIFKKKDDKGFNDFQILTATLRSKLKNAQQMYDLSWKALAKAIESGKKADIKSKVQNEFRLKQQVAYLQKACELAHDVHKNYQDLFAEHPSKEIQDEYVELCTYRESVKVPQLGEFWIKHKIPGNDDPKPIVDFDESQIATYLREFADTHGVNQFGIDNLNLLFPIDDPTDQIPVGQPVFYQNQ